MLEDGEVVSYHSLTLLDVHTCTLLGLRKSGGSLVSRKELSRFSLAYSVPCRGLR